MGSRQRWAMQGNAPLRLGRVCRQARLVQLVHDIPQRRAELRHRRAVQVFKLELVAPDGARQCGLGQHGERVGAAQRWVGVAAPRRRIAGRVVRRLVRCDVNRVLRGRCGQPRVQRRWRQRRARACAAGQPERRGHGTARGVCMFCTGRKHVCAGSVAWRLVWARAPRSCSHSGEAKLPVRPALLSPLERRFADSVRWW